MELAWEPEQLGHIHYGIITVFCRPVQGTFSEEMLREGLFLSGKFKFKNNLKCALRTMKCCGEKFAFNFDGAARVTGMGLLGTHPLASFRKRKIPPAPL